MSITSEKVTFLTSKSWLKTYCDSQSYTVAVLLFCACFICLKPGQNSPNYDRITPQKYKAFYLNKWNKHKSLSFIRLVSLKFTLLRQEDVFYTYSAGRQYSLHVVSQHFHTHLFMHMLIVFSLQLLCFVQDPLTAVSSMHHQSGSVWVIHTCSLPCGISVTEHAR